MKNTIFTVLSLIFISNQIFAAPKFVFETNSGNDFPLVVNKMTASVVLSDTEAGVRRAANSLMEDFRRVTGFLPQGFLPNAVIIGTLGQSEIIDNLIKNKKVDKSELAGKREKYIIQVIDNPTNSIKQALVIAGSDRRGTIYGIYELSAQIGVSPWYWWADVPVIQQDNLFVKRGKYTDGEPTVEYRGIFLNDEAPALSGWAHATFGGFNHNFYEKVFELILRLKGNFLWPAMWGNAFYDDDAQNGILANQMGVVIGTSHHEPMGRAHDEWRRYGSGAWNYQTNSEKLQQFWRAGMERMKNWDKIITVGMRGDGDEPMSESTNISLLENIISVQRSIIQDVTKKPAEKTPQLWALYKEVQDYYDKGMRVPDDVTLLLCDDNWGNVRKLPALDAPKRSGGYGIYYHFDYVGGPRNYKWLNVSQIQRVWEQMNLTYQYGVSKLWIVNVGDLKPMEFPISFFMDMAWNPNQFNVNNLMNYTEKWCAQQFGEKYAKEAAAILNLQNKYAYRVTPEMLDANTYSLDNYNEFERVVADYKDLNLRAMRLYNLLPAEYRDAFDQLVLFPVNGICNLYEMYFAQAKNRKLAAENNVEANFWADKVKECYDRDSLLSDHYHHEIAGGKWNFMMSQIRIGYDNWQQPDQRKMPAVTYLDTSIKTQEARQILAEKDGVISFEAENFSQKNENAQIKWTIIPDFGKTKSGIMTYPQNVEIKPNDDISLIYKFENQTVGDVNIHVLLAPTLNFNANKGLRFALSIDGGQEIIVNFNEKYRGELGDWQAQRIIKSVTKMKVETAGQHSLKIRALDNGIVFEKIMLGFGGLKPSYLGAPTM